MNKTLTAGLGLGLLLCSIHSNAANYQVSSQIDTVQLWSGFSSFNTTVTQDFEIYGTAQDTNNDGSIDQSNINFDGQVTFNAANVDIRITFALTDGNYSTTGNIGTSFHSGSILIETLNNGIYEEFEVANFTENTPFSMQQSTNYGVAGQPTAGLTLTPGSNNLPGLWDGIYGGQGFNNALSGFSLFATNGALYTAGTITVEEVPIPAAGWLFGCALLGLAQAKRKK